MTMGAVTSKLGLASTCSTTYYEPFDVARRFATLDLMTNGRAAWNVVTSVNDGEAHNMGREEHLRARSALRQGRRVHGGGARPLGYVGRRLHHHRQEDRPLRRPDQGEAARSQGQVLHLARPLHRAALAAGPSRHHPGRRQRPRPAVRRTLGRGDLRRRPQHRDRQGGLQGGQGRGGAARPRSRPHLHLQHPHAGRRRHQGGGRGQDGDHLQAAARDRCAVAAGRGAQFRFRVARASTSRSRRRS